jgi:hypothetical protein
VLHALRERLPSFPSLPGAAAAELPTASLQDESCVAGNDAQCPQAPAANRESPAAAPRKIIEVDRARMRMLREVQDVLDWVRKKLPYPSNQYAALLASQGESVIRSRLWDTMYETRWNPKLQKQRQYSPADIGDMASDALRAAGGTCVPYAIMTFTKMCIETRYFIRLEAFEDQFENPHASVVVYDDTGKTPLVVADPWTLNGRAYRYEEFPGDLKRTFVAITRDPKKSNPELDALDREYFEGPEVQPIPLSELRIFFKAHGIHFPALGPELIAHTAARLRSGEVKLFNCHSLLEEGTVYVDKTSGTQFDPVGKIEAPVRPTLVGVLNCFNEDRQAPWQWKGKPPTKT